MEICQKSGICFVCSWPRACEKLQGRCDSWPFAAKNNIEFCVSLATALRPGADQVLVQTLVRAHGQ